MLALAVRAAAMFFRRPRDDGQAGNESRKLLYCCDTYTVSVQLHCVAKVQEGVEAMVIVRTVSTPRPASSRSEERRPATLTVMVIE